MKTPTIHTFFGVAGHFLLFSFIIFWIFRLRGRNPVLRITTVILCAAFMFLKINGVNIAGHMRGILGDLSLTTIILLGCTVGGHLINRDILPEDERRCVLTVVAISGLALYPLALGLMWIDPYRLGFSSFYLILPLAVLSILGYRARRGAAVIILAGMIAFNIGFLESTNLWDYLIDPIVTLYAWTWIIMDVRRTKFCLQWKTQRETTSV